MKNWYKRWFGKEYLDFYPHRDEHDAAALVELIESRIPLHGSHLLDLACGPGRHARELARHDAIVTGLDLSAELIRLAAHTDSLAPVRGDMRFLPFATKCFDCVVNLFTSFGYFHDDSEHRTVIREVHRVTKSGGHFVIDYLNPTYVRATLIPSETSVLGGDEVYITRAVSDDGRYVIKKMRREGDDTVFVERVRLFEQSELAGLLEACGLTVAASFGDYDGAAALESAPRQIMFARAT
ncbi:MAG: class I SAM-dependent methyltransferase [Gemmatimonadales bacterium]